jgi:hypothetical protein
MRRQKQITLLAARVAAVGANLLLQVGDYWEPKESTKLYARVLLVRAPQSQRTINQEEEPMKMNANPCKTVSEF